MKLHNKKTGISYNTRTIKESGIYKSIVERWECDANGIPLRASLSSMEKHPTRAKARYYAERMAIYQFMNHCAIYGLNA
jgi:hypothetical protein